MTRSQARVLLIEDDAPIRQALEVAFRAEGYEVWAERDGSNIEKVAERFRPDLAILDVRLPSARNGYDLARILRLQHDTAVLFVSAADSLQDRLDGFEAGADDYVVKPFLMAELMARARALLRRAGRVASAQMEFDDIVLDEASRTVRRGTEELELTRTEYELLSVLLRHPRQVLSKHQLLTQVWGYETYEQNRVEVHMSALRRKLEAKGPRVVHTVRGIGYILR